MNTLHALYTITHHSSIYIILYCMLCLLPGLLSLLISAFPVQFWQNLDLQTFDKTLTFDYMIIIKSV